MSQASPLAFPLSAGSARPATTVWESDLRPSAVWDFVGGVYLGGGAVTFTRASSATYFDSAGVQTAATDALRFDSDPVTLAPRGILIEGARTNLFLRSEEFSNASWVKSNCTITADAAVAPDGAASADTMVENAGSGVKQAAQTVSGIVSGTTYTISLFVKAAGRSFFCIQAYSAWAGANNSTWYDLSTGTVSSSQGSTVAGIQALGGGWYRLTYTRVATATGTGTIGFFPCQSSGSVNYTGDGVSGVHVWGAQIEVGSFASSYIPTTTASATRAADVLTAALGGWFNTAAGTAVPQWRCPFVAGTTQQCVFSIDDGTANNRVTLWAKDASGNLMLEVVAGGVQQCAISGGAAVAGQSEKVAVSWKANQFALSRNGATVVTEVAGSVPTGLTTLRFGSTTAGQHLFGTMSAFSNIPRCVSNAELQALSA